MIKNLLFFLVVAILLAGCGPQISQNKTQGKDVEFIKGQIVKDFPSVPLYRGAKVEESYGLDKKYGASFSVKDDLVKVVNFYTGSLPTAGWESSLKQISSTNYIFDIKNATSAGTITINTAADGKTTAISIAVEPR